MVDITNKIEKIKELIDDEFYFTINRPRQFGKTTTLYLLKKNLNDKYIVVSCSFEGLGDSIFLDEKIFSNKFLELMVKSLKVKNLSHSIILSALCININNLDDVANVITDFISKIDKDIILFMDEVDKSSNNQLFLSFLGMLRNKYLLRELEEDLTFKSIILAGVHDVKTLKIKIREGEEVKLNDDLFKNIENNNDLKEFIFSIIFNGEIIQFNKDNPLIYLASLYGIIKNENNNCKISNRVFEQRIYNYFSSRLETKTKRIGIYNFLLPSGGLDMKLVLIKFQQFMKAQYSSKDIKFLEKDGRTLFLAFLKLIINGVGFDFINLTIQI